MRLRSHGLLGVVIALILAIPPAPGTAGALPAVTGERLGWQFDERSYESPQFGYLVEWDDAWAARERDAASDEGGLDSMVLSNNDGLIRVDGQGDETTAAAFLADMVERATANAGTVEIVDSTDGDISSVELIVDLDHILLEAQTLDNAVVVVSLRAREDDYEAALAAAQEGVTLNGTPILSGEAAGPTEESRDEPAAEATEEPSEDATEEPSEDATEEPAEESGTDIDGTTYTSPDHGYSVTWDDEWEATSNVGEGDYNELFLSSGTGSLTIIAGSFYDGDPETCLEGEDAYFGTEDPEVRDWQMAVDANGDPVTGGSEGMAYAVFTLSYGDEEDGFVDLVDYIECRALVPGETTLEIFASTTPDLYEEHIAAVLEITNEIEMPAGSGPVEPADPALPDFDAQDTRPDDDPTEEPSPEDDPTEEPTEEPAEDDPTEEATEEPNGESGLDGDTFTSPAFGFTVTVPEGWTVEDDTVAEGDETLVVNNGVSTIAIHATDAYGGDLAGCIGYARDLLEGDPAYAGIRLDTTTGSEPFQGVDDRRAYALFTYTGEDGEEWAHFIQCQSIVEGESVLILSHDVPYEDYASERQARRQIQNAIDLP